MTGERRGHRRAGSFCAALVIVLVAVATGLALATGPASTHAAAPATGAVPAGRTLAVAATDPRPNIVLITTDDQTVADLAVMRRTRALVADAGTSFVNSYTPFALCCPDRASILTGQYAHNHGVLGNGGPAYPQGGIDYLDSTSTIATWLSEVGYQTAMVGKYLNGYGPQHGVPPGWEDWHASLPSIHYYDSGMYENGSITRYPGQYQTDVISRVAAGIVSSRVPDERPLFLWTSYFAPHAGAPTEPDDPLTVFGRDWDTPQVADRHRDRFDDVALPDDPSFNAEDVSDKPAAIRSLPRLTPKQETMAEEDHQQRLEALLAVDEGVAALVEALRRGGELDNTVILFTSDNGFVLGQFRIKQGKSVPYEPAIRVPLLARGPGFPAGAVRSQPTATMDLTSTIIDLSGARRGRAQDGLSLLDLAADPEKGATRDIVLEAGPRALGGPMYFTGLRTSDDWTYVEYADGDVELYDDAADPFQLENLAGVPAQAGREARLRARLATMRSCAWAACLPAVDRPRGPATDPPPPRPPLPPVPPGTPGTPVPPAAVRSSTVIELKRPARVGREVRLRVTVVGAGVPSGTVAVRVRGRPRVTQALSGGRATVRLGRFAVPGRRVVAVSYGGAPGIEPSRARLVVRVRSASGGR